MDDTPEDIAARFNDSRASALAAAIYHYAQAQVLAERERCAKVAEALIGTHSAGAIPKVIRDGLDLSRSV